MFSYVKNKLDQNKLIKHFIVYLTSVGVSKVIPTITLFIIASFFTPREFGLVSNFGVIVQLFGAFISLKLSSIVQAEYYGQTDEERKDSVSNLIYLMVCLAVVLIFFSIFLETFFLHYLKLGAWWVILASLVGLFTGVFRLRTVILRMEEKPKQFAYFQSGNAILISILNIVFVVLLDMSWQGRVYANSFAAFVMLLLTLSFFFKQGWIPRKLDLTKMKNYFYLGLPLLPHAITPFLNSSIEKIVITDQLGLSFNGLYSFAITISTVFLMIIQAFYSTYVPNLYKNLKKLDESKIEEKTKLQSKIILQSIGSLGILAILILIGYLFALGIIKAFFDVNYLETLDYLPWVLLRVFLHSIFLLFSHILIYAKQTKKIGFIAFLSAILNISLVLILVPKFGIEGVLYSIVVVAIIRALIIYRLSQKIYYLPWLKIGNWSRK